MNPNAPLPPQPPTSPGPPWPPMPPKKSRSGLMMLVVVVLLVAVIGGLAYLGTEKSSTGGAAKTTGKAAAPAAQPPAADGSVVSHNDGKLDLASRIDPQVTATAPQALDARLNQQVNLSDGTSLMVTKVERNWTPPPAGSLKAEAGKELVKVTVVAGNRATAGVTGLPNDAFTVLNAAGSLQPPVAATDAASLPDVLKAQDIAPGQQVAGALVYQVNPGEKLSLVVNKQYQNPATGATVAFNVQVTLD